MASPQPEFRRCSTTELLAARVHQVVAERTAALFPDKCADDDAGELEADLLRVEPELGDKELRNLERDHDGGEAKCDGIADGRDQDTQSSTGEKGS